MTIRRRVLRELRQFNAEWPNSWLGARDIRVFRRDAVAFAAAVEELATEGLILRSVGDRPAETGYRLNPERASELRRELAPSLWRVMLLILFSLVAGAMAFMTIRNSW